MYMIELPKTQSAGTFWIAVERIVSMEARDNYGRYTNITTDQGAIYGTSATPEQVTKLIEQATKEPPRLCNHCGVTSDVAVACANCGGIDK